MQLRTAERFETFIHNLKTWQFLVLVTFFVLLVMGTIFIFAILLSSLLPMGSPQDPHAGGSRHLFLSIRFGGMPRLRQSWTGYRSSMFVSSESAD
jgi:hypothetical protein